MQMHTKTERPLAYTHYYFLMHMHIMGANDNEHTDLLRICLLSVGTQYVGFFCFVVVYFLLHFVYAYNHHI